MSYQATWLDFVQPVICRSFNHDITQKYYNEGIKIVCKDNLKYCCYPILISIIIDYKKQVLITIIKANI